jgi:hypothetical protein
MVRGSSLLIVLAGCGQLFGLDVPVLQDASHDIDAADAALAEGCVTLPLDSTNDDDADGLTDDVDNCIGDSAAQMDSDGDGIGNACDERTGKDTRFCVWTFQNAATPEFWPKSWDYASAWLVKDSKLVHTLDQPATVAAPRGPLFSAPAGIAFDTFVTLGGYTQGMAYGEEFSVETAIGFTAYRCQLRQANLGEGTLELTRDGAVLQSLVVGAIPPNGIRAYVRFAALVENGKLTLRCTVKSNITTPLVLERTSPAQPLMVRPGVFATGASVEYDHVTLYKLGI